MEEMKGSLFFCCGKITETFAIGENKVSNLTSKDGGLNKALAD